jgi:ribonuclease T1
VLRLGQAALGSSAVGRGGRRSGALLAGVLLAGAALLSAAPLSQARDSGQLPKVALAQLPPQAQATHGLIERGGPFPYRKDGTVFGNRERLLPGKPRGYYREYTVDTPGSRDRGARRIVCGGEQPRRPDACYYTADHYSSFKRIAQ